MSRLFMIVYMIARFLLATYLLMFWERGMKTRKIVRRIELIAALLLAVGLDADLSSKVSLDFVLIVFGALFLPCLALFMFIARICSFVAEAVLEGISWLFKGPGVQD